ncbi:MAG: hypothetical protein U9Q07_03915 [Planctomycetota bacterium]|nr:hypothetical protein [Planctomycetota bacterium]
MDKDRQLVAGLTRAVRAADEAFERSGGSSRHWVYECFIPALEMERLVVVRDYTGVFPSLMVGRNQARKDIAHCEAVLVDCQKAHDVTIAGRDELNAAADLMARELAKGSISCIKDRAEDWGYPPEDEIQECIARTKATFIARARKKP